MSTPMISSTIDFLNKFRECHPATQRRVQDWWAESSGALVCHSASPDEEGGRGNYFAEYLLPLSPRVGAEWGSSICCHGFRFCEPEWSWIVSIVARFECISGDEIRIKDDVAR